MKYEECSEKTREKSWGSTSRQAQITKKPDVYYERERPMEACRLPVEGLSSKGTWTLERV